VEIVTLNYAEIQKVKSSFEVEYSISSTQICNEFGFFESQFTSLHTVHTLDFTTYCNSSSLSDRHQKKSYDVCIIYRGVTVFTKIYQEALHDIPMSNHNPAQTLDTRLMAIVHDSPGMPIPESVHSGFC